MRGVSAWSSGHSAASCPMNQDFVALLRAFVDHNVRFMVVDGYGQIKDPGDIEGLE